MLVRTIAIGLCLIACAKPSSGSRTAGVQPSTTLPDPDYTPGSLCTDQDDYFDGYRYPEHVAHCARHVTMAMKREIAANYGVAEADFSNYEFDHYLPLGIGGSTDVANLWPEPKDEALDKDKLENELYNELSSGSITQAEAVQQMKDWRESVSAH